MMGILDISQINSMKLKVLENYLNDVTTKYRCIIKDEEKNLILDCLLVKDGLGMEVYMGLLNKKEIIIKEMMK